MVATDFVFIYYCKEIAFHRAGPESARVSNGAGE